MNISQILHSGQHKLAKSQLAVNLAIKLRNQCNCIIAYYLADTPNHLENGESWLIENIAPECNVFVDVGAYIGDWTEYFLKYAPKSCLGLLFEPGESAFQRLEDKFRNHPNLILIQSACSDTIGEAVFYDRYPKQNSSLAKQKDDSGFSKRVKLTTLDQEIKSKNLEFIDFLKIDCEGYDFNVLRGGIELLSKKNIGVIQFEYGDAWAASGSTLFACIQFLNSFKYEVFLLNKRGLLEFNYDIYGDYFRYSNFVAISQSKVNQYQHLVQGLA